ncbi:MAG: DNA primase family protein [Cognatishimia sp.]
MALDERIMLKSTTPSHLAAEVISQHPIVLALGMWLQYQEKKGHYVEIDDKKLTSIIYKVLDGRAYQDGKGKDANLVMTKALCANVKEALVQFCLIDEVEKLPFWLPKQNDHNQEPLKHPEDLLVLCNGLLDWRTGELIPLNESFVTTSASPVKYEPEADAPLNWEFFLNDIFDGDQEQIDLLHEVIGALITRQNKFQKIFQIIGPSRSGKGTIGRVLVELIGEASVCSPKISQISSGGFGLESLIGKTLATVTDARISRGTHDSDLTEKMLTISGGDFQTIPRKYKDDFRGYIEAQWLLMSNEPVLLKDLTGTIAKRMVLLETLKSFLGKEDPDLFERDLQPELPAILNLCLAAARKLEERGRFLQPKSISGRQAELVRSASSVSGFANECLEEAAESTITKKEVYDAYLKYCNGHSCTSTSANIFWRDLRASGKYRDTMELKRTIDGKRTLCVKGLCLIESTIPSINDFDEDD